MSYRLDTPRRVYQSGHRIAAGCLPCHRWHEFSFLELERVADRPLVGLRFHCVECGGPADCQARSPGPTLQGPYLFG